MKKITQTFGYLGSTMLAAASLSWICVFLIHGLPGVYIWMALKFIIPILGFVGLILNIFLIILSRDKCRGYAVKRNSSHANAQ